MLLFIYTLTPRMVLTSHNLQLPGRITIEEVAKTAGVSISTVSRALAGKKGVGEATRTRILKIAAESGYRTSSAARSLRTSRTHTLAYLTTDLDHNSNAIRHMSAVIDTATQHGYSVIVINTVATPGSQLADRWQRHEANFDGLIMGMGRFDVHKDLLSILQSNMPMEPQISLHDPDIHTNEPVIPAYFDRRNVEIPSISLAVRRLVKLGHRRMAFIVPGQMSVVSKARLHTIIDALKENGLDENAITRLEIDQPAKAIGQFQQLMVTPAPPTAIISVGGTLTHSTLRGLASLQVRIPEDVSLLTFDDSPWHRSFFPPISVIRLDLESIAMNQVERIVARIEGKPIPAVITRPSEFIDRGSLGPAP